MKKAITITDLSKYTKNFTSQNINQLAMNATTKNGVKRSAQNYKAERLTQHEFSINLEQGKITNQKQSGRCWMFAALNMLRFEVIKKFNLKDFELSQNFTLFYDKLEKANYFLESILDTLKEASDSRIISFLLSGPLNDGGQWDMITNIIQKYGLVPKSAMPETISSSATMEMTDLLTTKLREDACILRKMHQAGKKNPELRKEKGKMLEDIYRILCICLGEPPQEFDFEYRDKDKVFHRDQKLTPQSFYKKYLNIDLDRYVSIINAPTQDKPYHKSYSVKFLGNVQEGKAVRYVNLPIEELKKAAIAQLKDGHPVWFGCDVAQYSTRIEGIMDLNAFDYEQLFSTTFGMNKAERLEYGESLMTHAMTFMGVDLDDAGKPLRWRVENSWGDKTGKDGYYVMTDEWFEAYMYQVVVDKKYVSKKILKEYNEEPVYLEPWDPMGSLA